MLPFSINYENQFAEVITIYRGLKGSRTKGRITKGRITKGRITTGRTIKR